MPEMPIKKYSRNFIRGPFYENLGGGYTGTSVWAHHDEYEVGVSFGYHCIDGTDFAHLEPHTHQFDELLMFFGGNPRDIKDFGAEVSFCLGEEMEEHLITGPTIVRIPAGLVHCPLKVNRCDKPIVMVEVSTTKEYVIIDLPKDK
jgi:hypothetical protein